MDSGRSIPSSAHTLLRPLPGHAPHTTQAYMDPDPSAHAYPSTKPIQQPVDATLDDAMQPRRISAKNTSHSSQDASEPPPPWAELKTKAGKDRKRLPLACVACRRKKIRCSGEKPACKHCLKSRTPCVYKVSTRKAGPRTDYMAMLDKRLKRMEERVIKIIPKDEVDTLPDVSRAVVKPNPQDTAAAESRKRSAREAFGPGLDEWASSKPVQRSGQGASSQSAADAVHSEDMTMLSEGKDRLPSQELQDHLAEVYFSYVYGASYHLLHKPSFMRKLATRTVPPVLLLTVCAVSARFSNHPKIRSEPSFLRGDEWAEVALEIALRRFDSPNITILTVLLLLGLHEFGTCRGGRSWMLGGMAIRMAYALQLHKDLAVDPCRDENKTELSFTDREIRRRTMWACFVMDRFNSSGTQRPMFASEDNMYLQLPIKEQFFTQEVPGRTETLQCTPNHFSSSSTSSGDEASREDALQNAKNNMGVSAYMIRVIALWGRLVQYLNLGGRERDPHPAYSDKSTHKKLRDEVALFYEQLPESLQYSEANLRIHIAQDLGNQFLYLHIAYQQCVIVIYRFGFPHICKVIVPKEVPVPLIQEARAKCIAAAHEISRHLERAVECRLVAPFTGYCAYLSSAVLVHCAFSGDPKVAEPAKAALKVNVTFLSGLKRYWGNFYFLTESLRDLWRQFADLANKGTTTPNPRAPIAQYGDWYDRYPHGVTQIDFEGPITMVKEEPGADAAMAQKADVQNFEQFSATLSPKSRAKHVKHASGRQGGNIKAARRAVREKGASRATLQGEGEVTTPSLPNESSFDPMEISVGPPRGFPVSYDRSTIFDGGQQQQQQQQQHQPLDGHLDPRSVAHSQVPVVPYGMNPMQPMIGVSQLDQQMATLPGYTAVDQPGMVPDMANYFWDMDFNNMIADDYLMEEQGWFAPFNLNPPGPDGNEMLSTGQVMSGGPDQLNMAMAAPGHMLDPTSGSLHVRRQQ